NSLRSCPALKAGPSAARMTARIDRSSAIAPSVLPSADSIASDRAFLFAGRFNVRMTMPEDSVRSSGSEVSRAGGAIVIVGAGQPISIVATRERGLDVARLLRVRKRRGRPMPAAVITKQDLEHRLTQELPEFFNEQNGVVL